MEEPAVRLLRRADLDHGAGVPIGGAEQVGLLDPIDHLGQDPAVPAAGLAGAADALDRVPAPAVGLPGHAGVAAHLGDFHVAVKRLLVLGKIMHATFFMWPGLQNRIESLAGVRNGFVVGGDFIVGGNSVADCRFLAWRFST